jgi:hypothetical protein
MTLSEYELLERDFLSSSTDIRTFLQSRGVSHHKYYYWKRRSRELKEPSSIAEGQFLPIDLHSGGLIKPSKRVKRARQPLIGQGEIEIEPQANAMFSLNDSMRYLLYSGLIIYSKMLENAIRLLAIGRKNYLFCGNADAATRAAIIYSLLGSCKAAVVNPSAWLEDVFSTNFIQLQ